MPHMRGIGWMDSERARTVGMSINLPDLVVPQIAPPGTDGFMQGYERNVIIGLLNLIKAEVVIEIGVQRGQGARLYLDHVPTIQTYIGIDVEPGYQTTLPVQQSEIPAKPGELVLSDNRFHLWTMPRGSMSFDELPYCDAVVIDGDHSATVVVHDTLLAEKSVRSGGLILWHDYAPGLFRNEVGDFIDMLRAKGRDIRHIPDTWLALEIR